MKVLFISEEEYHVSHYDPPTTKTIPCDSLSREKTILCPCGNNTISLFLEKKALRMPSLN